MFVVNLKKRYVVRSTNVYKINLNFAPIFLVYFIIMFENLNYCAKNINTVEKSKRNLQYVKGSPM